MSVEQLTLDGSPPPAGGPKPAPLTATQHAILNRLRERGVIRSVEAGQLVHAARAGREWGGESKPQFWASDGTEAMKRLAKRGLVRPAAKRGEWVLVEEGR